MRCLAALLACSLQHVRPAHHNCLSWVRNCVGQPLALMEARAAVAMLAASFEFAPDVSMKGKREQWLSTEQVFRVGSHAIACRCLSIVSIDGGASGGTQVTLCCRSLSSQRQPSLCS